MLLTIIEFAFVTLGVKFLLGLGVIYALFPADPSCPACDAETLPLVARRGLRRLYRACRLRRRWCPRCGLVTLTRAAEDARRLRGQPVRPSSSVRSSQ